MDTQNSIRCMRHCSSDYNIFFLNFPQLCPICRMKLKGSFLLVPPFCVPHPFLPSAQSPYSVVVKPTKGSFLNDYKSGDDLHIGITTSTGVVYNYDETGVHLDQEGWSLCIVVNILDVLDVKIIPLSAQEWDRKLGNHVSQPDWIKERYHLSSNNCYSFVLSFLRTLVPDNSNFQDKETFCEKLIIPQTTRAAQYIDLYRSISKPGVLVVKATTL